MVEKAEKAARGVEKADYMGVEKAEKVDRGVEKAEDQKKQIWV